MENSSTFDKILCLYCPKSFLNTTFRANHVEREHCCVKGRRSDRIKILNVENNENTIYPGCFYCNNRKCTTKAENLDSLLNHLLSKHQDEYFGCKSCKIHFDSKNSFLVHNKICKNPIIVKSDKKSIKNVDKSQNNEISSSKCDNLSTIEKNIELSKMTLPTTNAIQKKSDRSKSRSNRNLDVNEKSQQSSKSTNSSDDYNILTRRKKNTSNNDPVLSRLGVAQNRSTSGQVKKNSKNRNNVNIDTKNLSVAGPSPSKSARSKSSKAVSTNVVINPDTVETSSTKSEIINTEFDEDFYKNIGAHVRTNLNRYIDGKVDQISSWAKGISSESNLEDFKSEESPAPQPTDDEKEIHEATNFIWSTPFPALLTVEQYGSEDLNTQKIRRQATKNSWKWKWDVIKKYKYVNDGGKIVKKVKQITTGQRDLSKLDMWTQLCMRSRYEKLFSQSLTNLEDNEELTDQMSLRTIKSNNVEQLNSILENTLLPEIFHEQNDQTVVKLEKDDSNDYHFKQPIIENPEVPSDTPEILRMFNLTKTNQTSSSSIVLSGEWARPRCYICFDCGKRFDAVKQLEEHKNSEHPYVVSADYEIVGRENIEKKFYKQLFFPNRALLTNKQSRKDFKSISETNSFESSELSISSESSRFTITQKETECTKCQKMIKYSNDTDICRHILDCIGDPVWMQAKRRMKYRRSRRRRGGNRTGGPGRKTKIAPKEITSTDTKPEPKKKPETPASKETTTEDDFIQRMLADLPPKRNDRKSSPKVVVKSNIVNANSSTTVNKTTKRVTEKGNIKNFFKVSKGPSNNNNNNNNSNNSKISEEIQDDESVEDKNELRISTLRSSRKQVQQDKSKKNNSNNNNSSAIVKQTKSNSKNTNENNANKNQDENFGSKKSLKSRNNVKSQSKNSNEIAKSVDSNDKLNVNNIDDINVTNKDPLVLKNTEHLISDVTVDIKHSILAVDNVQGFKQIDSGNDVAMKEEIDTSKNLSDAPVELPNTTDNIDNNANANTSANSANQSCSSLLFFPKKKKVKKLNDCIAMLTCKIQEKLGVNFFENNSSDILGIDKNKETDVDHHIDLEKDSKIESEIIQLPVVNETITDSSPNEILIKEVNEEVQQEVTNTKVEIETTPEVVEEKPEEIVEPIKPAEVVEEIETKTVIEVEEKPQVDLEKILTVQEVVVEEDKPVEKLNEEIATEIPSKSAEEPAEPICSNIKEDDLSEEKVPETNENSSSEAVEVNEVILEKTMIVSIPKSKIPNLSEILSKNKPVVINNITITVDERRAFEEQKNRIMQILNKTSTLKKTVKEMNLRKARSANFGVAVKANNRGNRKVVVKKAVVKKPVEPPKPAADIDLPKLETILNIEKSLKTSNRMRCRRLSVCEPKLSAVISATNKNRKFRTTNNSQQNSLFDAIFDSSLMINKPIERRSPANASKNKLKPDSNKNNLAHIVTETTTNSNENSIDKKEEIVAEVPTVEEQKPVIVKTPQKQKSRRATPVETKNEENAVVTETSIEEEIDQHSNSKDNEVTEEKIAIPAKPAIKRSATRTPKPKNPPKGKARKRLSSSDHSESDNEPLSNIMKKVEVKEALKVENDNTKLEKSDGNLESQLEAPIISDPIPKEPCRIKTPTKKMPKTKVTKTATESPANKIEETENAEKSKTPTRLQKVRQTKTVAQAQVQAEQIEELEQINLESKKPSTKVKTPAKKSTKGKLVEKPEMISEIDKTDMPAINDGQLIVETDLEPTIKTLTVDVEKLTLPDKTDDVDKPVEESAAQVNLLESSLMNNCTMKTPNLPLKTKASRKFESSTEMPSLSNELNVEKRESPAKDLPELMGLKPKISHVDSIAKKIEKPLDIAQSFKDPIDKIANVTLSPNRETLMEKEIRDIVNVENKVNKSDSIDSQKQIPSLSQEFVTKDPEVKLVANLENVEIQKSPITEKSPIKEIVTGKENSMKLPTTPKRKPKKEQPKVKKIVVKESFITDDVAKESSTDKPTTTAETTSPVKPKEQEDVDKEAEININNNIQIKELEFSKPAISELSPVGVNKIQLKRKNSSKKKEPKESSSKFRRKLSDTNDVKRELEFLDAIEKEPVASTPKKNKFAENQLKSFERATSFSANSLNDDSFFNDDNETSDKFSDIVNNIINSSELVDLADDSSDCASKISKRTLQEQEMMSKLDESFSSMNQSLDPSDSKDKLNQFSCNLCCKTFRSEKSLEKHNLTQTHVSRVEKSKCSKSRKKKMPEPEHKILDSASCKSISEDPKNIVKDVLMDTAFKEAETVEEINQKMCQRDTMLNELGDKINYAVRTKGAMKNFDIAKNSDVSLEGGKIIESDDSSSKQLKNNDDETDCIMAQTKTYQDVVSPRDKFSPRYQKQEEEKLEESRKQNYYNEFDEIDKRRSTLPKSPVPGSASPFNDFDHGSPPSPFLPDDYGSKVKYPRKGSKINRLKETTVSIPTKSLIMGKIFKKQKDKLRMENASKLEPKSHLDELFDHLKNTNEIDDKILNCPSPRTFLKSTSPTVRNEIQTEPEKLPPATENKKKTDNGNSQIVDGTINSQPHVKETNKNTSHKERKKSSKEIDINSETECNKSLNNCDITLNGLNISGIDDDADVGIGKRKSRRKCTAKTKTLAETWSSDEYEEFHNLDVITLINEIEKADSSKKHTKKTNVVHKKVEPVAVVPSKSEKPKIEIKASKLEDPIVEKPQEEDEDEEEEEEKEEVKIEKEVIFNHEKKSDFDVLLEDKEVTEKPENSGKFLSADKNEELPIDLHVDRVEKQTLRKFFKSDKRSVITDNHVFDLNVEEMNAEDEMPIANKYERKIDSLAKTSIPIEEPFMKNRNDDFDYIKKDLHLHDTYDGDNSSFHHDDDHSDDSSIDTLIKVSDEHAMNSEKQSMSRQPTRKKDKVKRSGDHSSQRVKKKNRKRSKNKPKNIAYDSDSDFELNLNKKSKYSTSDLEWEREKLMIDELSNLSKKSQERPPKKTVTTTTKYSSNNHLKDSFSEGSSAFINDDLSINPTTAANRTKRHSTEKLYYWSSSSDSDQNENANEKGDDIDEEILPQHGWIVGDSHKKLVTLLAHAKIKNKIN